MATKGSGKELYRAKSSNERTGRVTPVLRVVIDLGKIYATKRFYVLMVQTLRHRMTQHVV